MAAEVSSCTEGTLVHGPVEEEHDSCWICLDGPRQGHPLVKPCSCPRTVHAACLAKWQLTSAGRNEETRCRFCNSVLPDWRPALTPTELRPAASVMSVRYRGVTHKITYTPGPDGLKHFLETLQSIGIKVASASQVTFLCRSPDTGEEMALKGLEAFDAAAYCASITAAKRVRKEARRSHSGSEGCSSDLGVRPEGPESPTAARSCERHVHAEALHHSEDWDHHHHNHGHDTAVAGDWDQGHQHDQQQQQEVVQHPPGQADARHHHRRLASHTHALAHWWARMLGCVGLQEQRTL